MTDVSGRAGKLGLSVLCSVSLSVGVFADGVFFHVISASIKTHSYKDRPNQQESRHQVKFYQMLRLM